MAQKKKAPAKTVRIECEGAALVKLDDLVPLQGDLKILDEEGYQSLRKSILDLGFSFPNDAWKFKGKIYILDAHQRVATLRRMRDREGYTIPPLPTSWVKAVSFEEAAQKLLAAAGQYGKVQPDGLNQFMKKFNIKFDQFAGTFKFPEIDVESFRLTYFPQVDVGGKKLVSFMSGGKAKGEDWKGMPEFKQDDKEPFRSIIIHFYDQKGVDDFAELIKQKVTEKTRMAWYPEMIIEKAADKRYGQSKS